MAEVHETAITVLPDQTQTRNAFIAIHQFQEIVHSQMRKDHDYGIIPGTSKPTLLKPGAEKIAKLLGLADQYIIVDKLEDWDRPFFRYLMKCQLIGIKSGVVISEGLGECNSMEGKYRWRDAKRRCPECGAEAIIKGKAEYGGGYICFARKGGCGMKFADDAQAIIGQKTGRVENDDIYSQVNTILKMAKKRALVDAALSAGRLSELFTQDVEDMVIDGSFHEVTPDAPKQADTPPASATTTTKKEPAKKQQTEGGINWGNVNKLSSKMGLKSVIDMNKALKVSKPSEWHGTEEQALDRIFDYAQVNGYQGAPWREIEL